MKLKIVGIVIGAALFLALVLLPPFQTFHDAAQRFLAEQTSTSLNLTTETLARSMQTVAAMMALMVTWWLTEAIRLAYTALVPLIVLPLFGVTGFSKNQPFEFSVLSTLTNYFSPVVLLFLGGFLIAAAMQKWKLDRRFTLWFLTRWRFAEDSRLTLLGMMLVTAFISMWISNTATTAMMLPLGLGILSLIGAKPGESRYGTALMLGIAWSSSIGGVGTLLGTPPNGIAVGILNTTLASDPSFHRITFVDWLKFGIPFVILFLPVAWFVLMKAFPAEVAAFRGGKKQLLHDFHSLGNFSAGEKGAIIAFGTAVFLWIATPFADQFLPQKFVEKIRWLDEYNIGLIVGVSLFFIPLSLRERSFMLHWRDTRFVEWSALLITGGGIALSNAMFKTGFASWLASSLVAMFGSPSIIVMMFVIALFVVLLTEIASNSAVTSMMVPVVISIAKTTGYDPVALALTATFAATMGFMMPVGTPPNAMVYATGFIRMKDMVRVGFILDLLSWLFTVGILVIFGWLIFGVISL